MLSVQGPNKTGCDLKGKGDLKRMGGSPFSDSQLCLSLGVWSEKVIIYISSSENEDNNAYH